MTRFRVFVGAPSQRAVQHLSESSAYKWQTVSPTPSQPSLIFPPATLDAASRRISLFYQNIIFHGDEGDGITYDQISGGDQSPGSLYSIPGRSHR